MAKTDYRLATTCLENLYSTSDEDATFLYACLMEAQQDGQRLHIIRAMQVVLEKYGCVAPVGVHLLALIRYVHRDETIEI